MNIKNSLLSTAVALLLCTPLWAANTKTTVTQVSGTVTLTDNVDYIVSSASPFAAESVVNIENTDHAVLILAGVKPSKTLQLLAGHVQIGGERAVNNTNCQVKLYNRGSIILPYGNSTKPLTVYSEQNFEGQACSDFGLENSGGFMNTLTEKKLNNRIRSFKLKRGYMVTFSLKANGRGYSRCFIAADKDLEMATLPAILDRSISSYRIFKWYDAGKPALANDTRSATVAALNVTSCYSFGLGETRLPDAECVPHHIYEDWPSAAACGGVSYSPHMKTNNEPRNSADDHPQDLNTILNNWENLMATGMRLCSPSSWDGSDYVGNAGGFLREFFDSIDARGWRCDIIDLHCYWAEGTFGSIKNWVNAVHRPVWISEWVWGASWNNNGIFGVAKGSNRDNPTQAQLNENKEAVQRICNNLNSWDYIERYFYWNSEANCSKLYYNDQLTPAGQMYCQLDGGVGYNGKYDYAPKAPKQQAPTDFNLTFDRQAGGISFAWREYNAEMNEYIHLERRKGSTAPWEVVYDIGLPEEPGRISISSSDIEAQLGWEFRISEKDANGKVYTTKAVMAASSDMRAGDAVDMDGQQKFLGGNIIVNGRFSLGLHGWTNGTGAPLAHPWFQTVDKDDSMTSCYLQCYGNGSTSTETAVKTVFPLQPATDYYFQAETAELSSNSNLLIASPDGEKTGKIEMLLDNTSASWNTAFTTFNSEDYPYAILSLRTLGCKARFANMQLRQLFNTRQEALADGIAKERERAEAVMQRLPLFQAALSAALASTGSNQDEEYSRLCQLLDDAVKAQRLLPLLRRSGQDALALATKYPLPGHEQVEALCTDIAQTLASGGSLSPQWVLQQYAALEEAMQAFMPMETLDGAVQNPLFEAINGWTAKAGTYKGGTQQISKLWNPAYFEAFWTIPAEGNETQTMAISQTVKGLDHGLYAVSCQAATCHYCITDQHGYITDGADTLCTPTLSRDRFDLAGSPWEQLTSTPLYVEQNGSVSIGFTSSKQNAQDLAWHEVGNPASQGDHREGSWGATSFALRFFPLYIAGTVPRQWGVTCLPRAASPSPGLKFYQIAALTSDFAKVCLEEISETEPGVPFMYMAEQQQSFFLEHGEGTAKTTDAPGNLRGFLSSSARVPVGYYILTEGVWRKLTDSSDRPRVGNNTAIMRPFDDNLSQPLPVVDAWDGPTVAIEGITDEERQAIAAGIRPTSLHPSPAAIYDLSGRRLQGSRRQGGIYIQKASGKITKKISRP